ncbi:MAG: hypothetical protein ABSE51_20010 [Terracidiphilus sp.]
MTWDTASNVYGSLTLISQAFMFLLTARTFWLMKHTRQILDGTRKMVPSFSQAYIAQSEWRR